MRRANVGPCAIALLLGQASGAALAKPSIHGIHASRTSGVAPLAVLFDATDASDPVYGRPFHTLRYTWDFGDPGAGSWAVSGQGKNAAHGPVAGHLFTTPGVYTVTLAVVNPAGESATESVSISVADPTEAIGSRNTYCFADHDDHPPDWSGCPLDCGGAGAARCIVTGDFDAALRDACDADAGSRQCLFRRGDEFAMDAPIGLASASPGLVGAFGSGARPRVRVAAAPRPWTAWIRGQSDWRVAHLDLEGDGGGAFVGPADLEVALTEFTVYDVDAAGFDYCFAFNNNGGRSGVLYSKLAVVDFLCERLDPVTADGWSGFDRSHHSMYMGLRIHGGGGDSEGLFRAIHMNTSVIQHSYFGGNTSHGAVSIRSCARNGGKGCVHGGVPNRYIVFSDNHVEEGNGIPFRTCTHAACDAQGEHGTHSRDILIERNLFEARDAGIHTNMIAWFQSGDLTFRNNAVDLTHVGSPFAIHVAVAGSGPSDGGDAYFDNVHVLNNTIYHGGTSPAKSIVVCSRSAGGGHVCRNNLVYAPAIGSKIAAAGEWAASHNLRDGLDYACDGPCAARTIFAAPSPARLVDFQLRARGAITSGTDPVDGGFSFAGETRVYVATDAFLACRGAAGPVDVGAHELGAHPCGAGAPRPRGSPESPLRDAG
jgi:PKD repeat protein